MVIVVDPALSGSVRVRAHAKLNLNLRILARRDDGYHDLRTVFQALALHDTLVFTARPGPFFIECSDKRVPTDSSNLVWRAADLLWRRMDRAGTARNVAVRIEKCIPMKAGLGGGSADGAAALVGLATLWRQEIGGEEMASLGRQLGADVPFFFTGGTALGVGRGDEISSLPDLPALGVLLVFPSFDVSTADAYRWVDEDRASAFAPGGKDGELRRDSVRREQARTLADIEIVNDFEPVVAARHPQITGIVSDLLAAGATAAAMTGSGSTVFGVFEREAVMAAAARSMNRLGYSLTLTRTLTAAEYAQASAPACL